MNAPLPTHVFVDNLGMFEERTSAPMLAFWQRPLILALLIFAAAIPLLYPPFPPLVDLPGHMGRYRVQLDLERSADLQRYFTFHWQFIGNLGVDLLLVPIAKLAGLQAATKLVVVCIPPLTVTGFLLVAKQAHGRVPATALLALPLAYSQPFHYGFLNFTLSMALAFLGFAWWLRMGRAGAFLARSALFVPIGILVFTTHTFGWATLCILALSNELAFVRPRRGNLRSAAGRVVTRCLCLAPPLALMILWRAHSETPAIEGWFVWQAKAHWLLAIFRRDWAAFEALSALGLMGALILLWAPQRSAKHAGLVIATALLAIAFVLLPDTIFGSTLADMRLAPYLLATALLALSPKAKATPIAIAALALFAAHLSIRTVGFARDADDQARELAALDHVRSGARVYAALGYDCADTWTLPVNDHLNSFVITRRDGFTNNQWVFSGMNLLGLRDRRLAPLSSTTALVSPRTCASTNFPTAEVALAKAHAALWDYAWLIHVSPGERGAARGWTPVWRSGDSILFRRT